MRELLLALVVTGISFALLNRYDADPPAMGTDAAVWFSLARDCLELDSCRITGARSSFGPHTGSTWIDLLMLVQLFGGDSVATRTLVVALLSIGIGTVFIVSQRWLSRSVALMAAAGALVVLASSDEPGRLWNPSSTFFPAAVYFAAMLVFACSEQLLSLCVAAVFLSLAVNTHLSAAALVPSLAAIPVLRSARPWKATLGALTIFLIVGFVAAFGATALNLGFLLRAGHWSLLPGAVFLLAVLRFLGRPLFLKADGEAFGAIVALSILLPWGLGTYVASTQGQQQSFVLSFDLLSGGYGMPVIAPAATLLAILLVKGADLAARALRLSHTSAGLARGLVASVVCLQFLSGLPRHAEKPRWTIEDVRTIEGHLAGRGWDYERLVNHLQNADCWNLLGGIVAFAGIPTAAPAGFNSFNQVRIWVMDDEALPLQLANDMWIIRLRRDRVAVISEIRSWLDPANMQYCQPAEGADELDCSAVVVPRNNRPATEFLFTEREGLWYPPSQRVPTSDETLIIPLAATEQIKEISVYSTRAPNSEAAQCPWRIAAVEGLAFEPIAPNTVRVKGRDGVVGRMLVERPLTGCSRWDPQPPCFIEKNPGDPEGLWKADFSR